MDAKHFEFLARQPSARLQARERFCGLPKRSLAFLLANIILWQPLWAQAEGIAVSGQGTSLGAAGNGVPIVNIAAPNASGLSHNQFSDYNVGSQGVILNNATGQTQSTQLGGIILGNGNLKGNAANTILNEVTGNNRSQLKGYTEVAGQSARVIVANPYGITCNGCGFINTPRATLTTGKPILDASGRLQSFQVDGGDVLIDGAGISANNIDSFEVITRSAKINGQINARKLTVVAGRNDVNAETLDATARADDGSAKPALAIDSSALGGMYANTIKLVGTEKGVGVHVAGDMAASAGDIQLDASGHLIVGQMAASGAINVQAGSFDAQGPAYGKRITVRTAGDLQNQKSLAAQDSIHLDAGGQLTNNGVIEAGVNPNNSLNSTGDVTLSANQINNTGHRVIASRDLTATTTGTLNNQGGTLSAQRQHTLNAATLDNSSQGQILSNNGLAITAGQVRNNQGVINSVGAAELRATQLDNSAGQLISNAQLILHIDQVLNPGGLASGWDGVSLDGTGLDNRASGTLSSRYGDVTVSLTGTLRNGNAGALVSAKALKVTAASLDNQAGFLSSGTAQTLTVSGLLDNSHGGSIDSGAGLVINAMTLGNANGTVNVQQAFSLSGTDLDNSTGTLASNGGITLDLLGALSNVGGTLNASGPLLINRSTSIDNRGGQLASQSLLSLFADSFDNRGGTLAANGLLTATTHGALNNGNDGLIYSPGGGIQLNAGRFDNSGGTLQAQTDLNLDITGQLSNQGGRINARNGDATVRHGGFDNGTGGLYALGNISLSGDSFSNASGGQVSGKAIDMTLAGALSNHGIIESDTRLALQAASLDNQYGQLRALATRTASPLARSLVADASQLTISGLLDNRNGTLEFANADLDTQLGSFTNDGGSLLHTGTGTLGLSTAQLLDAGGSIVSRGTLTLQGDNLVNRTALQAGQLNVNANQFTQTATGKLLATDHFNGSGINWSNDGTIATDGTFDLALSGAYSGNGTLTSQGAFTLGATQLSLGSNAVVAAGGNTQITLRGLLDNTGRLSSSANLTLNAGSVNNRGSLGSAGQLVVTANSLVNDHGLIFSGTDMGLRVASLNNLGGALYSLRNLRMDRDGQGTQADSIVNSSGSIQSDGAMALLANSIDNIRTVLTLSDPGVYTALIENLPCIDTDCDSGKQNYAWRITQYQKLAVLDATAASSITAGGDLLLQGGALRNHSSTIATGGNLTANLASLDNTGVEPGETVTSRAYRSERTRHPGSWFNAMNAFNAQYWKDGANYSAAQLSGLEAGVAAFIGLMQKEYTNLYTQTYTPTAGQTYAAVIQAAGAATVTTQNGINNSVVRSGYNYIGAGQRTDTSTPGTQYSTQVSVNRQLAPDLAQQQVDPTALPDFSLPIGQNGLFRLSGQSATGASGQGSASALNSSTAAVAQKYLIETNPLLTNLKQFMSSDYLLSHLGYNPDDAAKRLGDGFYEQRLIQQAVLARTGQRYIDGQTSDESMFKYLMNNAIASKDELNLSLGTKLSSEQVAALTHDIVWMENTVVNGETVLVPVLYLANANNRLAANGALIQGSDLTLITGAGLNNAGTLRASNNLAIQTGDSVVNSGLLEAGERLDVLATNTITNRAGGLIAGRDVSVTAVNGDVLNERTVTTHQSSSGYRTEQTSFADNVARVEASGNLAISAGHDVNNLGGVLQSSGNTALKAGHDVNVVAAQQVDSNVRSGSTSQTIKQNGSVVTAGGGLSVVAANDATVVASQMKTGGDLSMAAGNDLTLNAAADEQHAYSKTKKVTSQKDGVTQVGSDISAGGNVTLNAGNDLGVVASRVTAGKAVDIDAGQDVTIGAATNENYAYYYKKNKGSFGRSSTKEQESYDSTNVASVITAGSDLTINTSTNANGGVSLDGGRDVSVMGSQLKAGHDVMVGGTGDVAILSGTEEHGSYSKKTKSGFLGLSKSGKSQLKTTASQVASDVDGGNDVVVVAGNDVRVRASNVSAANDAELRAGLVNTTGDINLVAANDTAYSKTEKYSKRVGVMGTKGGISFSEAQKAGAIAQSSTNVGSQVSANQDATLNAARDINIVGSGVSAGRNITLGAGQDVNVIAGTSTTQNDSWEKTKSVGVKVSADRNGFTAFAGQQAIKQTANGIQQTAAASQLSAGQNLTVDAGRDILQQGSDAYAENDIAYQAGRNIVIDAASEHSEQTASKSVSTNGISGTINHNLGNTRDALSGAGKGEDGVSKASSTLKAVDAVSQFLNGPTMDGHIGNTHQSQTVTQTVDSQRGSTVQAGNDVSMVAGNDVTVRGSGLNAGRDISIGGRNVTIDVAKGSQGSDSEETQSKGGILGGTSGGFKIGIGASTGIATGDSSQDTSTPSALEAGRDINLIASNDLSLIGTQAQAQRDINLKAGNDLTIKAAQNDSSNQDVRHNGGGSVGIAVGQQGIGVYASVDIGRGNLDRQAAQQQDAYFATGDQLNFTSGRDTTISGATLRGDTVNGDVGRNLTVSSAPNTGKVSGKEFDVSATVVIGPSGGSLSGSVGYGRTTGSTKWVEKQTSITAANDVNIRTQDHTQLDGALLASDAGKLLLDTGTLGFSDIAGKDTEHAYYLNVGGSYATGGASAQQDNSQVGKGKTGEAGWSASGYKYDKDRQQIVRATVGAGDVVVRGNAQTGADSTTGLNRDVGKAYQITKDDEHRTDLYVTKSSVDAVLDVPGTLQQWEGYAKNYGSAQVEELKGNSKQIWDEVQAQTLTIDQVPESAVARFGKENALAFAKNLARAGMDPDVLDSMDPAVLDQLAAWGKLAANYGKVGDNTPSGTGSSASQDTTAAGSEVLAPTTVEGQAPTLGTVFLYGTSDFLKYMDTLAPEQMQITMLGMQAMMGGPAKAAVSAVGNALLEAFLGDKIREYKEALAIKAVAGLTGDSENDVRTENDAAKAFHADPETGKLLQLDGSEGVVAAEFLIDLVAGGVKSLTMKAAGKVFSVSSIRPKTSVNEGEVGSYGATAPRSVRDGLTPDHVPSFAAVKEALRREGIDLPDAEIREIRKNTTCVVVKTCSHIANSRTFGGRNNAEQVKLDGSNLYKAAEADIDTWVPTWKSEGWSNAKIDQIRSEVHAANKKLFDEMGVKYEP
ncbi:MAG: hemagglutinin repeat-containing protein [Janthinobacterium lividum]|uniref:hemagglutinin repeat-containing protein n=1 Tax=Pseudomonas sp. MWU16-30317 TaxID=2878095 RepID=UPI001CF94877|nr:hemagglutinin repeat-containing protein [Pseudomonas sp. MWU16-30317]